MATLPVPREYLSGHTLRYKKMIKMLVVSCYPDHPIQFHTIICVCCQKTLTRSQYHEILFPGFTKEVYPMVSKSILVRVNPPPFFLLSTSPGFPSFLSSSFPPLLGFNITCPTGNQKKKKVHNASL